MIKLQKSQIIGISAAVVILIISGILLLLGVSYFNKSTFYFVAGIAAVIAGLPFFIMLLAETKREKDKEEMFLEFSRDLAEGVKAGTPINKSIVNIKNKDYGSLNPHIAKLANQVSLGIPVKDAFDVFAADIKSAVIGRAVSLIREAERSGGKIESILESVSYSVAQIEKLKKERQAAIYNLTVQGYIIFFIFIAIMLIMQFQILPMVSGINSGGGGLSASEFSSIAAGIKLGEGGVNPSDFAQPFLFLLLAQGFFIGLVIGKISEGTIRAGLKHSFILVGVSWLISSGANLFLAAAPAVA